MPVLVILADTPTFAYRPKEIKNGLSIPPQMSVRNVAQMMMHPTWSLGQLAAGAPEFKTMTPYIPKGLSMKHLGLFMNRTFSGRLNPEKIAMIRDRWKGKLVVKGIVNPEDAEKAIDFFQDQMEVVSHHNQRDFSFLGRSFMYGVGALGEKGGRHTIMMLKRQLQQVMEQIGCETVADFPKHLVQ